MTFDIVETLAASINSESRIEAINFTGGEPTLLPDLIRALQSKISRRLHYSITTNGWMGSRIREFLAKIKIDSITLSFDKFHLPFIKAEKLVQFIAEAKLLGVPVELNFVYERLSDLTLAKPLVDAGAILKPNRLISGGRARSMSSVFIEDNALKCGCPSLEPSRKGQRQKVIYYPEKGFSSCCGPLVFDYHHNNEFVYTRNLENYEENPLRKSLAEGSFGEQAEKLGLDLNGIQFSSPCEVCVMIYAPIQNEIPSLAELARQQQTVQYYPSSKRLPSSFEKILDGPFHIKYFCMAALDAQASWLDLKAPLPGSISTKPIQEVSEEEFGKFTIRSYYDRFTEHQDQNDRRQFLETIPKYFKEKIFGKAFYKDDIMVGVIITHQYQKHPAVGESTLHIGYWGYDRDSVNPEEARGIKADWFTSLAQWSQDLGGIPVDASIDWFNNPAFKMATDRGFKQVCLRLDKRCESR